MAIASSDKLVVVKAFAPSNPLPLDAREIYDSLAEAQAYAKSSAIAYAGQTIKVVDGNSVTVYTLVPSSTDGTNYDLSFVGGGAGSGVLDVTTSTVEGNINVSAGDGTSVSSKNVPVVGALVNPVIDDEQHTLTLTKLGATAQENSSVVIPLGGASPDSIISAILPGQNTLTLDLETFDEKTEEIDTQTIPIYGAAENLRVDNAGVIAYDTFEAGVSEKTTMSRPLTGTVINPEYNSDTKVLSLPIVQALSNDHTASTEIVTVDLKQVVDGAFTDVSTHDDSDDTSAKHNFFYHDGAGDLGTVTIFEGGVRKVAAGTTVDKIKVIVADATTGNLSDSEILVGAGNVKNPTYDADTRKITLPTLQADGTTKDLVINLGKDMVVTSGTYNTETHDIELTLTDGTVIKIAAGDLIDIYTGAETSSATVSVSDDNKISVAVRIASAEKVADNVLKVDATNGGLYVSEADFTATKKLISDGDSTTLKSAKDYTDTQIDTAIKKEVSDRDAAIKTAADAINDTIAKDKTELEGKITAEETARTTADTTNLKTAKDYTDEKVGDEATARDTAIETALQTAKDYADEKAASVGTTWVDFGTTV